jgi:hypothetical protein
MHVSRGNHESTAPEARKSLAQARTGAPASRFWLAGVVEPLHSGSPRDDEPFDLTRLPLEVAEGVRIEDLKPLLTEDAFDYSPRGS